MANVTNYLEPALVQRLNQLQLTARRVVQGTTIGLHRSRLKGSSVEFHQHRIYVSGDEPKRLDWRLLGRTDRHYVREFQEESNLRAVLMLDRSGSMNYGDESRFGTKFNYASRLLAALAYLMLGQTESVGLAIYGEHLERWVPPQAHSKQLSRIIDMLERTEAAGPSSSENALLEVADCLDRRGLVIVISDFFQPVDQLRRGLARLRHDRHEVIVMQVIEPDEQQFPFANFTQFRGLEGEFSAVSDATLLRKTYLKNFQKHQDDLSQVCRALGVAKEKFVIDRPLADAVVSFLRQRAGKGI